MKAHSEHATTLPLTSSIPPRAGEFEKLVGDSETMRDALSIVRRVASSTASVLLLGESGTGKELFAEAVHRNSARRDRPFVRVACAALPETLLESELFGHEKGAFTGAIYARPGRFEIADGGTLFLDEIGDLSPTVQVKLLRFLEEHEFERVGGNKTVRVDVRIVTATNRDLKAKLADGSFREDLYFRLNVIEIRVPALRERTGDVLQLARHFLAKFARANGKAITGFTGDAMALLARYSWPGNVRELENAVERAVVLATEPLLGCELFASLAPPAAPIHAVYHDNGLRIPGSALADIERAAILRTLDAVDGSTIRAARILHISPRKIQYKLKEYQERAALPASS
jgi:transcriptional regulator with GAF, ATPase, and Fis domain